MSLVRTAPEQGTAMGFDLQTQGDALTKKHVDGVRKEPGKKLLHSENGVQHKRAGKAKKHETCRILLVVISRLGSTALVR